MVCSTHALLVRVLILSLVCSYVFAECIIEPIHVRMASGNMSAGASYSFSICDNVACNDPEALDGCSFCKDGKYCVGKANTRNYTDLRQVAVCENYPLGANPIIKGFMFSMDKTEFAAKATETRSRYTNFNRSIIMVHCNEYLHVQPDMRCLDGFGWSAVLVYLPCEITQIDDAPIISLTEKTTTSFTVSITYKNPFLLIENPIYVYQLNNNTVYMGGLSTITFSNLNPDQKYEFGASIEIYYANFERRVKSPFATMSVKTFKATCAPECQNGGKCGRTNECDCDGTDFVGRTCSRPIHKETVGTNNFIDLTSEQPPKFNEESPTSEQQEQKQPSSNKETSEQPPNEKSPTSEQQEQKQRPKCNEESPTSEQQEQKQLPKCNEEF